MNPSDETPNNNCDKTEQTTLIEVNSDFWKIMRELIRAELHTAIPKGKKYWDKTPKGDAFWNEAEARVKKLITTYGYVTSQILIEKDPWFSRSEFDYSAQIKRLLNRLVNTSEYVRFRISEGTRAPWYITRKEWKETAEKKALIDKKNGRLEKIPENNNVEDGNDLRN